MNNRKFVIRKDPVVDRARQANQELRMRLNELSQLARIENRMKNGGENSVGRSISQSVKGAFTGSGLQPNSKQSSTTSPPPSLNKQSFIVQPQGSASVAKLENQARVDPQSVMNNPMNKSTTNLNSQQQLNRIEETSMRQLDSISKLQNRLLKTNSMMYASAGGGAQIFASNDYLCEDIQGTTNQPGYMTGMPKKVTINPKRSQQQMLLNHSNAAAFHSSKIRHHQRQSSLDRSILKQGERMIDTSTDASTRDPTNRNSLPAPGRHFNSNSSYRTPLKPMQPLGKVFQSKTPGQLKKIPGTKPPQQSLYTSMTQIQQEQRRLSKPVHGNQDLNLDETSLATSPRVPVSVAKRAFRMREEEKAGKKIVTRIKDAKSKKQMARRQSPEAEDGEQIKWGDESPVMTNAIVEHARFSDPVTHYFEPVSPTSPSQSTLMQSQLNSEQRQMLDQMIDKLDLQEAIRQKARIFFNKQEEKLKFSESNLDKIKNIARGNVALTLVDDKAKQVMKKVKQSSFNEGIQLPGKKLKHAINPTRSKAQVAEDQEILDDMYNERQVSSQKDIQWDLKHMMEDQSQDYASQPDMQQESKMLQTEEDLNHDTLELTDGQMFDKEGEGAITLNSSICGSSIIPEEKYGLNKQAHGFHSSSQSPDEETNQQPSHGFRRMRQFQVELPDITGGSGLRSEDDSGTDGGSRAVDLLKISNQYKSAQKAKLAKTMYNHRPVEPRQKLASFKKDYSPLVLGYRFGLNQKGPDPKAPPALRYSQMASYRFAESNSRYMELYDEQLAEFRKTRRFLSKQISQTPEGRAQAQKVLSASPEHTEMHRRLQLQLIHENINEDTETNRGLKELQKQNLKSKAKERRRLEHNSDCSSQTSNSHKKQMRQAKDKSYVQLLRSASAGTLQSETVEQLGRSQSVLGLADALAHHSIGGADDGLDIHEDFISDADEEEQAKMHKVTYEMEAMVQDEYFKGQEGKMGLALFCREQLEEQKRYFRLQQKQLISYLDILFNGNKLQPEYINMAKNLTSKLKRQRTDCSAARQEANEIHESHMQNLEIDDQNINTEIISMLADDIMKKTDFFAMFKDKDRGKKAIGGYGIGSPITTPMQQTASNFQQYHRADLLRGDAIEVGALFPRDPHPTVGISGPGLARQANVGRAEPSPRRLPSRSDSSLSSASSANSNTKDQERAIQGFIDQCEKSMVVTLPLLLRMTCKKMILEGYQLNHGLCQALSIAFSHFREIASDFHLDSNSLTDDDFAVLLQGMGMLKEVQRLSYSNNAFGQKSLEALLPLLSFDSKRGLRSLHLKHCKITAKVTTRLLQSFNHQRNYIKSLSLVNVNLCQLNCQALCEFISQAKVLHELDISWNGMRCHQMYELLAVIVDNRTLQYLNLSYNNFQDQLQEKYAESTPAQAILHKAQMEKLNIKRKKAKTDAQKAAIELEAAGNSMQQVRLLIHFIKMNSNLMYLDLSGMQMTQAMMNEFGRGLRRTKSLVSLHLSQNCGDTQELRDAIAERAHIAPVEEKCYPEIRKFDVQKEIAAAANNGNTINNAAKQTKKTFKLDKSVKFKETRHPMTPTLEQELFKEKPVKTLNINEQLTLKNMLTGKRGSVNRPKEEKDPLEMLVYTRYLGHKAEIPGSGQWRMISSAIDSQERCWVSNLEMYSLIFWSREYGLQTQRELAKQGLDELTLEEHFYELEQRNKKLGITVDYKKDAENPQLFEDAHKVIGYPQIYGEFNNWKPQRMYTIEELCYLVDKDRPNIIADLKKANYLSPMVEKVADMNDREKRRYYDRVKGLFTKYNKTKNWRKNLGNNLRYKKPFLANSEALLLVQGNAKLNLAKMNEQLLPSDSESDFGSGTESERSEASPRNFSKQVTTPTMRGMKKGGLQLPKKKQKIPRNQLHTAKDRERMKRQLYVVPCFLKPGKQTLVVQSLMYQDDLISADDSEAQSNEKWEPPALGQKRMSQITRNEGIRRSAVLNQSVDDVETSDQFFIHQVVAPARRERVPHFAKKLVQKQTDENQFNRDLTVFKEWKPPSEKDLQAMFAHDKELWKLPRFIKDEGQLREVYDIFRTNLKKLFHVFITVAASSNFPGISWLDFTRFADTCRVVDKAINQSDIDRYFLAAAGDNQNTGCLRYQFFEALMRVADAKYLKSGRASTYGEALSMFLQNNCFALGPTTEWQEFRDDIWWNYETHKIMDANLSHLNKLYQSMWAPRKKHMTKGDCVELMVKKTSILHDENRVSYCYGMSKMCVIKETQQKQVYEEMKFIEFQEFLGRCAHMKYDDEEPMGEKLKMLLDELLPVFGMTRVEVEEEEVVLSESDPDY